MSSSLHPLASLVAYIGLAAALIACAPPPQVEQPAAALAAGLPPAWTPTSPGPPTRSPLPPTIEPTTTALPANPSAAALPPDPTAAFLESLLSLYPAVDPSDLYLHPTDYTYVRFRLTSAVVRTGFHESYYPGTPQPVNQFIVQLDPRVGNDAFQVPFVVVGIAPTQELRPGMLVTVYGYGLGPLQGENAMGGMSAGSAIFAESYSIGP